MGCVIGVDGPAAGATELDLLEAAGVLVRRVPLEHGPVFENIERDGRRRQRWLSRSDAVPAAALPAEWRRTPGWLLGTGELDLDPVEVNLLQSLQEVGALFLKPVQPIGAQVERRASGCNHFFQPIGYGVVLFEVQEQRHVASGWICDN